MNMDNKKFLRDYPNLLKEWDYEANQNVEPRDITLKSSKKFWWTCEANAKHTWLASVANRTKGTGCPYCAGKKVVHEESFGYLYKDFVGQWNFQKNEVSPFSLTPFSNKKFWWKCGEGHEWETSCNNRSRGRNCPYCSRSKVTKEISLAKTHPNLSSEWHPIKNYPTTPFDVLYGTQKKFWWKCGEGHEWEASCNNRSRGRNCPYCMNIKVSNENCLETLRPELVIEWDKLKNKNVSPKDVTLGSDKKVWWRCSICQNEWTARVNKRAKGQGCPNCNRQFGTSFSEQALYFYIKQVFTDAENRYAMSYEDNNYELDIYIPSLNLAIEYDGEQHASPEQVKRDETKNSVMQEKGVELIRVRLEILPNINSYGSYVIQSHIKDGFNSVIKSVFMKIKTLYPQLINISIPNISVENDSIKIMEQYIHRKKINSIAKTHPHLVREWYFRKNGQLSPENFSAGSNNKVWWKCEEGHEWNTTISHRTSGTKCPYCCGQKLVEDKCLAIVNPSLSNEWHEIKNEGLSPNDVAGNSNKKVWWKCSESHEWEATINNRNSLKRGCPYCSGRKATEENCLYRVNSSLAIQWHPHKNGLLTPKDVKPNSGLKVWWKCSGGHEWQAVIQSRNNGRNCPYCSRERKS